MPRPKNGDRFTYTGTLGLGHAARVEDPDLDDSKPDNDMEPGTVVTVDDADFTDHMTVVAWTDEAGTPRRTSVPDKRFGRDFERVS